MADDEMERIDDRPRCLVPEDAPGVITFEAACYMDQRPVLAILRGIQVGRYAVVGTTRKTAQYAVGDSSRKVSGISPPWQVFHWASGTRVFAADSQGHCMRVADAMSTYGPDIDDTDGLTAFVRFKREAPLELAAWLFIGAPGDYREWNIREASRD